MGFGELLSFLAGQPALQGLLVALGTEAIKRSPVGPAEGNGIRLTAALLAIASAVASSAASGEAINPEAIGKHAAEAITILLAAVGAWNLSRKA